MLPMPTEWGLRPVSSAGRVGAHSAVVWKRLYVRPPAASRSAVGVLHGPPKALDAPQPTSSRSTTRTVGAPARGGAARSAEGARRPEAHVVEEHDEDVRGAGGGLQRLDRRVRGVRVLRVV